MNYANDIPVSLAHAAFGGVSMSPERRGDSFRAEYAAELASDYEFFKAHATKGGTLDLLDAQFAQYRAGCRRVSAAFLASESRCISSFITGPSNFPVRRAEKRNEIARRRLNEMIDFRERARRAVVKALRPDLRPIMAGDSDAIERLELELSKAESLQGRMKNANKAIRANKKHGPEAQIGALVFLGFSAGVAAKLLEADCCGRIGFADYQLQNNNASIQRIKKRIASLAAAKAAPVQELQCANGIRVEDDPPANRVRIFFPGKPEEAVRSKLKAVGFRWSPTIGAWQAYRNYRSIEAANVFHGGAA